MDACFEAKVLNRRRCLFSGGEVQLHQNHVKLSKNIFRQRALRKPPSEIEQFDEPESDGDMDRPVSLTCQLQVESSFT